LKLSNEDILIATECALARKRQSKGFKKNYNQTDSKDSLHNLEKEVMGAQAELAFARFLGVEFPASVGTFKTEPDVPPDWEVRYAKKNGKWPESLVVRPDDKSGRKYVLVTGGYGHFYVVGWCYKHEARVLGNYLDPGKRGRWAWFVPRHKLNRNFEGPLCD